VDDFLKSLKISVDHLAIIDDIFSIEQHENVDYLKLYKENKNAIEKIDSNFDTKFSEELYVGGKKARGKPSYGRQMILNDIISYIFFGRGHYFIKKDQERKKAFMQLLLHTVNLLLIYDSMTVEPKIRKKILERLENEIGSKFFKNDDMKKLHEALILHDGDIGWEDLKEPKFSKAVKDLVNTTSGGSVVKKKLNDYFDSLLPKTGGGLWNELIVYFYLLRRTSVFIIPLLLIQRIHSKNDQLAPPDYLVIDKNQKMYGIEVGEGKERQSTNFSSTTGTTLLTTENTNVPPRCPLCGKFVLFCPKVIEDCGNLDSNPLLRMDEEVHCINECKKFSEEDIWKGKCQYTQYHGPVSKTIKKKSKISKKYKTNLHYHYSCIKKYTNSSPMKLVNKKFKKFQNHQNKIKEIKESIPILETELSVLSSDNRNRPQLVRKIERIRKKLEKLENKTIDVQYLKTDYPYVRGSIKQFDNLDKADIVCFSKYDEQLDRKNCDACMYEKDCIKETKLTKFAELPQNKIDQLINSLD